MSTTESTPLEIISAALRRERDRVGLSLTELAKRAGIAKSTLSQLESGAGNPSVETLWALAVALGVPFTRLVDPPTPQVRIVRAGQATFVRSEQSPYAAALLSSCPAGARRDLYLLELEPGGVRDAQAHIPGTVEHVVLTAGRMRVGPESNLVEIGPGDYVSFSGDVPHQYEALEPGTTAVLVMEHV
ncbi:helix-turn-helix transcriptional regulator [Saccharopolyspora erythraea]|uniref:helix-turn-helix domain-containing protein n=1 Tax=Saccharopolyspora erythraea TaxID=1836 RepID=UPI001BAB7781|nr:XRE family transcriptional regulator [Saccharopolyspora erythraea]QUH01558.1 helix-turn-helix transcriptional regulator [Saccharopolyspora erythraea]